MLTCVPLPMALSVCRPLHLQADELYTEFLLPAKISRHSAVQEREVRFRVGLLQRLFLVLDDPQCCGLAKFVSIFMMVVIVLSCVIYVISTDASLR